MQGHPGRNSCYQSQSAYGSCRAQQRAPEGTIQSGREHTLYESTVCYISNIRNIWNIRIYVVYTAYIYVDGNPIYGLGQP